MPHIYPRSCKWALAGFKVSMQLFEEASHGRVLKEDQFGLTNHDLLVPVADMICKICSILRSPGPQDIYGLGRLADFNDRPFRFEDHAVVSLQHGAVRKRDRKLQPAVGPATAVPIPPFVPGESERVSEVAVIFGTDISRPDDFFDDRHAVQKRK